jgi:hypothetical protein
MSMPYQETDSLTSPHDLKVSLVNSFNFFADNLPEHCLIVRIGDGTLVGLPYGSIPRMGAYASLDMLGVGCDGGVEGGGGEGGAGWVWVRCVGCRVLRRGVCGHDCRLGMGWACCMWGVKVGWGVRQVSVGQM